MRQEFLVKETSFVLEWFRIICHDEHQVLIESRSVCKYWWSVSLLMALYTTQSSANSLILEDTQLGKSLINIRKSRGPSTLPWGTPDVTWAIEELEPLTAVDWTRDERKSLIHAKTWGLILRCDNLSSNLWWGTRSNALEKSRNKASTWIPVSIKVNKSLVNPESWVSQKISCENRADI